MDEKRRKKQKDSEKKKRRHRSPSNSSRSESDEWVEKKVEKSSNASSNHDDWMSMGGTLRTFTKDDIKPKREEKDKKQIDSYNPATSSRELNPFWKNGGTGVPETSDQYRKSNKFIKPKYDYDRYYSKSTSNSNVSKCKRSSKNLQQQQNDTIASTCSKSYNWRKNDPSVDQTQFSKEKEEKNKVRPPKEKDITNLYLSDEKMNKLAAKIVKAEIMGDTNLVNDLKEKLEAAKEFRKENPDFKNTQNTEKREAVLLIKTTPSGSSKPVTDYKDKISRRGNVKTHNSSGRLIYFANDDKYDLARMFEEEKYDTNVKNDMQLVAAASRCNDSDYLEDLFEERISQNRRAILEKKNEDKHVIKQALKLEQFQENCKYCIDSKFMLKHLMISCGNNVYLSLPSKRSLVEGHCILTTIHHHPCVTSVDEDVWEEILDYRKMITQFFDNQNKDVIFFETAIKLARFPHMTINCIPLPRDVGDMASIYFKKALLECETEWSMNKKIIELKGKNVRKGVPKGLPYFWVDFGMNPGFAHVIEDQQDFPHTFAQQIIGGMLDLDHRLWKKPQNEIGEVQRKKVVNFLKEWKPFETIFKSDIKR